MDSDNDTMRSNVGIVSGDEKKRFQRVLISKFWTPKDGIVRHTINTLSISWTANGDFLKRMEEVEADSDKAFDSNKALDNDKAPPRVLVLLEGSSNARRAGVTPCEEDITKGSSAAASSTAFRRLSGTVPLFPLALPKGGGLERGLE